MKTIQGDLLKLAKEGQFDIIAHGCNCFCEMGAGIAKAIKASFPEAYKADCATEKGAKEKIGTCSFATIRVARGTCDIVNAYTQYHWKGKGPKVDYDAVRKCMRWIKQRYTGKRIGLPKIGAGLAGGDWNVIQKIIEEEQTNENVTLVVLE
ncbi:MAG: macro domain-containing protein [Candidatus Brocadiae bacterium]|nr:macro domain-containing protein [Candidatus Brocadiia bacterium]